MGGNNRQRKSSGLFSVFSVFKSKKSRGGYHEGYDDGMKKRIWPSDEDKGRWGVAEPNIDTKAEAFIAQHYKKCVSESGHVQVNPRPAVAATATGRQTAM